MAGLKTQKNAASVNDFLSAIVDPERRADAETLAKLIEEVTSMSPCMWGEQIVGYGSYHYQNSKGEDLEWMRIGFSPRKQYLSLYIMPGLERYTAELAQIGKYKAGKSCLNLPTLSAIDLSVLRAIIADSLVIMAERYPEA